MPDYKSMYFHLAGKVADAIELLIEAQRQCEHMAVEEGQAGIQLTPKPPED